MECLGRGGGSPGEMAERNMCSKLIVCLCLGAALHIEAPDITETDETAPDVSLITNRVRTIGIRDQPAVSHSPNTELTLRSEQMSVAISADNAGRPIFSSFFFKISIFKSRRAVSL